MKIVIDPPDLCAAASRLVDAAADVEGLSLRLAAAPQPQLPAGFGDLQGTISSISQRLESQSTQLLREAAELRKRAALAQLARAVDYALKDPRYKGLGGEKLKKLLEEDPRVHAAVVSLGAADNITALVANSRKWQRLEQIAAARGAYNVFVNPNVLRHGEDDYRTLRGYMLWQERISHSMSLDLAQRSIGVARGSKAEAELAEEAGPLAKFGNAGKALELGGKGLAGLDVVLNAYTVVHGSDYHGVRGDVDRGVAGMSVLAGGTLLAATVAPVPVAGQIAAGAILTGAAVWTAANLVADHKKEIARAVTGGAKFVADHPLLAAPVSPVTAPLAVGKEVWDHRGDIEHAGGTVIHAVGGVVEHPGRALPWNW